MEIWAFKENQGKSWGIHGGKMGRAWERWGSKGESWLIHGRNMGTGMSLHGVSASRYGGTMEGTRVVYVLYTAWA